MQYIRLCSLALCLILWALLLGGGIDDLEDQVETLEERVETAVQIRQETVIDIVPITEQSTEEPTFILDPALPLPPELQEHTYNLCGEYGIPFDVAMALMFYESCFQLDAIGHNPNGSYDSGPMQINSINQDWLLEDHGLDITDAADNIEAALLILAMHLEDGDLEYALTAYNCGAAGAASMGGKSAFADKVLGYEVEVFS